MAFEELFKVYGSKNSEVSMVAYKLYEYGKNIALSQSSGQSQGLIEHDVKRIRGWLEHIENMVDAVANKPIPDLPVVHPTNFPCDMSEAYKTTTVDGIALNEDCRYIQILWMAAATELIASQSAGIAGSLIPPDYERAQHNIATIRQYMDEVVNRPQVDLPETASPDAPMTVPTARTKK